MYFIIGKCIFFDRIISGSKNFCNTASFLSILRDRRTDDSVTECIGKDVMESVTKLFISLNKPKSKNSNLNITFWRKIDHFSTVFIWSAKKQGGRNKLIELGKLVLLFQSLHTLVCFIDLNILNEFTVFFVLFSLFSVEQKFAELLSHAVRSLVTLLLLLLLLLLWHAISV